LLRCREDFVEIYRNAERDKEEASYPGTNPVRGL
jgi:hypothetical protein